MPGVKGLRKPGNRDFVMEIFKVEIQGVRNEVFRSIHPLCEETPNEYNEEVTLKNPIK